MTNNETAKGGMQCSNRWAGVRRLVAVFCCLAMPPLFADDRRPDSAPSAASTWEYKLLRHGDSREGAYFIDTTGVCTAMEQDLKEFRDRPHGMVCKRELDPALGFTRPKWEPLDIREHLRLVATLFRYAHWEYLLPKDPTRWDDRIKQMAEKEKLTLELTQVDLFGDGKMMSLVRFGFARQCDAKKEVESAPATGVHWHIYVVDPTLSHIDSYTERGFTSVQDDIFLFKGKVYTDKFWGMSPAERLQQKYDGELKIFEFTPRGVADICTFHYFDSKRSKGK